MARSKSPTPPDPVPREFRSTDEVDQGIRKLQRRIDELAQVDLRAAVYDDSGADDVARSNIRETIREVFGTHSPEYREHEHMDIWAGGLYVDMSNEAVLQARERGRAQVTTILEGLINRLREKREDLASGGATPESYFSALNLHPRIADVATDLFLDGYHWEAVFAAAKALVNFVKEKSGLDLDGAPLMRTAFSKNKPTLAFNQLATQTDLDEQEGMMHLFEGAALGIRNPGGHSFPEGSAQRALEYISLLSLLAYRTQEAKRQRS